MSYSDYYLKSRNRPSAFLYVLAFLAIGGFGFTFFRPSAPSARASKETLMYHSIVNLSPHQAGIYYQTSTPSKSWVLYGENTSNPTEVAFDERDTTSVKSAYNLHYVLLKDLKENTNYSYKIITDSEVISINNKTTFNFSTPKSFTASSGSPQPAYGKVLESNNQPTNSGFVIYYYPDSYPLVSRIKGGDWLISLNTLINRKDGKPVFPKATDTVKIQIINEDLKSTSFETLLQNTTPLLKTVIIGTPYPDDNNEVLSVHTENVATEITKPTPTLTPVKSNSSSSDEIKIMFPKDGAVIPGNNPLIKGIALAESSVNLVLRDSRQTIYTTKLTTNSSGEWKLNLPMKLVPGLHKISITTLNSLKRSITLSSSFTITKSGEEVVLGSATEEATITPEPTEVIAQISPTIDLPTATPTVTQPAVTLTPPVTGDNNLLIMIGSLALVVIAAGVLIVL